MNENDSVGGVQPSGGEKVAELSGQGKVCGELGPRQEDRRRGKHYLKEDHRAGIQEACNTEKHRLVRKGIWNLKLH